MDAVTKYAAHITDRSLAQRLREMSRSPWRASETDCRLLLTEAAERLEGCHHPKFGKERRCTDRDCHNFEGYQR